MDGAENATCGRFLSLGHECFEARKIRQALAYYRRALELGICPESTRERLWTSLMMLGDFASAWQWSDDVLAERRRTGARCDHLPLRCRRVWNGSPLTGETVLVRCYHELGDTIQFLRYAPLLKQRCREVIVEADPAVAPLVRSAPGVDHVVGLGDPLPPGLPDIESTELPHAFRTTLATIPANIPYVSASPEAIRKWRRVVGHEGHFRVGLVWSADEWNQVRSIPLVALADLNEFSKIALFSLQRGTEADQPSNPAFTARIVPLEEHTTGIMDTAAAIMNLHLVITVDTMVAHLAGALGKVVWVLLPFQAHWRWMLDREDSPWYPTMRLFRQRRPGEWQGVVREVTRALRKTLE
jgi:hypothetical protein